MFYIAPQGEMLLGVEESGMALALGSPVCVLKGYQFHPRTDTSCLWVSPKCFLSAFASSAWRFQCGEHTIIALVLLVCCFLPLEGKDTFSNEQVYIFINLQHSLVAKSVVKYPSAIFFDINNSVSRICGIISYWS